jgi:hypothetical protein
MAPVSSLKQSEVAVHLDNKRPMTDFILPNWGNIMKRLIFFKVSPVLFKGSTEICVPQLQHSLGNGGGPGHL